MPEIYIEKSSGEKELFDEEKLKNSLIKAGASSQNAEIITSEIAQEIKTGDKTEDIYKKAFQKLHKLGEPAAKRYTLKRAVMDLGPSGFPFEEYFAEILQREGYQTKTDQIVLGECVPHEIDVVAWNNDDLIMVEAKFHNELGIKSDLKVVLYVKARIEDLQDIVFNYGEKNRKITGGWLVTNTKFTTTAVHYAECKNLKLIGWNYPEKGNLHDLIVETKTLPITCISQLNTTQKHSLLAQKIVLCDSILKKPEVLKSVGLSDQKIEHVLHEISDL